MDLHTVIANQPIFSTDMSKAGSILTAVNDKIELLLVRLQEYDIVHVRGQIIKSFSGIYSGMTQENDCCWMHTFTDKFGRSIHIDSESLYEYHFVASTV